MSIRRLAGLGGAATLIALALPGSALAATLAPLKPCYVASPRSEPPEAEAIFLAGGGFAPNSKVDISVDGAVAVANVPVDAAGNLPPELQSPAPLQTEG